MTYLDEPNRMEAAVAYVCHELKKVRSLNASEREQAVAKIRSRVGDEFADLFIRATHLATPAEEYVGALEASDLWQLLYVLSYGWQEKELWNCLGLPEFRWELREIRAQECVMQSRGSGSSTPDSKGTGL